MTFDLGALGQSTNTSQASESVQVPEDFTAPYRTNRWSRDDEGNAVRGEELDPVSQLTVERMFRARPLNEKDPLSAHPRFQDYLLSATGEAQNAEGELQGKPRYARLRGAVFHNWTSKSGEFILVPVPCSMVRASYCWLPTEDMTDVEMLSLIDAMKRLGFKVPNAKVKDDTRVDVPSVLFNNSWRPTRDNKNRAVGNMAFTLNDRVSTDGETAKWGLDCRIAPIYVAVDAIEKANAGEDNATASAKAYVAVQKSLAITRAIDFERDVANKEGVPFGKPQNEREMYRLIECYVAQVYYGVSPVVNLEKLPETPFVTYHAQIRGIRDVARAGGNYQNVAAGRVTKGLDASFFVPLG